MTNHQFEVKCENQSLLGSIWRDSHLLQPAVKSIGSDPELNYKGSRHLKKPESQPLHIYSANTRVLIGKEWDSKSFLPKFIEI